MLFILILANISPGLGILFGIFKSENPSERAKSIVKAVTHYNDPKILADVSEGLKAAMKGLDISEIPKEQKFQERGW